MVTDDGHRAAARGGASRRRERAPTTVRDHVHPAPIDRPWRTERLFSRVLDRAPPRATGPPSACRSVSGRRRRSARLATYFRPVSCNSPYTSEIPPSESDGYTRDALCLRRSPGARGTSEKCPYRHGYREFHRRARETRRTTGSRRSSRSTCCPLPARRLARFRGSFHSYTEWAGRSTRLAARGVRADNRCRLALHLPRQRASAIRDRPGTTIDERRCARSRRRHRGAEGASTVGSRSGVPAR